MIYGHWSSTLNVALPCLFYCKLIIEFSKYLFCKISTVPIVAGNGVDFHISRWKLIGSLPNDAIVQHPAIKKKYTYVSINACYYWLFRLWLVNPIGHIKNIIIGLYVSAPLKTCFDRKYKSFPGNCD